MGQQSTTPFVIEVEPVILTVVVQRSVHHLLLQQWVAEMEEELIKGRMEKNEQGEVVERVEWPLKEGEDPERGCNYDS